MILIERRNSETRGDGSKGGWLKAKHTFSFKSYFDEKYVDFSDLLLLNEHLIESGGVFEMHPHNNLETFTYIIKGKMSHRDTINQNETIIEEGGFQYTGAGSGIMHLEINIYGGQTHLLQIWIRPDVQDVVPRYDLRTSEEIEKTKPLVVLASGKQSAVEEQNVNRKNPILINNKEAKILLLSIKKDEIFEFILKKSKSYYFQIVKGRVIINNEIYNAGDGAGIKNLNSKTDLNLITAGITETQMIIFELRKFTKGNTKQ